MLNICKKLYLTSFFLASLLTSALIYPNAQVNKITVQIPMRDGVELATDLYSSNIASKEALPCILLRTPGPKTFKDLYAQMANWGYIVAIQSTRSFSHSQNHPEPYMADAWGELQDGYDTITWLGESSYTNGNIGTYGASAMGITQLLVAPTRPTHLKCQFIQVATPTLYQHAAYVGGKFCKHQIECWFAKVAPKAYEKILENAHYSAYWEQIDASKKAEYVQTPAVHIGGWYDVFSQGTIDSFNAWQNKGAKGAKGEQKLIMGPWTHWGSSLDHFGQYQFPEASLEFKESELIKNWFDYYLKDKKSDFSNYAAVHYFVMGPLDQTPSKGNKWKTAQSWPPSAHNQPHYLSKSRALSLNKPEFSKATYHFEYHPDNPIPTLGGRNLYLESGPFDQSKNEQRDDLISFTTPILKNDTEVTGQIKATIYLSSSAPTTDLALTLTDVYPDGKSVLIAEGIQHVQFTNQQEIATVEIDLWSTSMVFAKGHQIRLNIASSNYPHFDKNPNIAKNVIYVGLDYPSQITLPIVLD